jgi:hypothetical protein
MRAMEVLNNNIETPHLSYVYDIANPKLNSYFRSRTGVLTKDDSYYDFQSIAYGKNGIERVLEEAIRSYSEDRFTGRLFTSADKIIVSGKLVGGMAQTNTVDGRLKYVITDLGYTRNREVIALPIWELSLFNLTLFQEAIDHFAEDKILAITDYR